MSQNHPAELPLKSPKPLPDRPGLGIALFCIVAFIFAVQDGLSRILASDYPATLVVMIRYWAFALFVLLWVSRKPGGLRRALRTRRPMTQVARGVILALQIIVVIEAFVRLGLIETHAIFAVYPLLVAALSGPVLGEHVGWRRWAAISLGFAGILVILQPGGQTLGVEALLPLLAAFLFAIYGLLTRHVARDDPSVVSFFWTGVTGAAFMTVAGIGQWQWLEAADWIWMACLCVTGITSHYLMIRSYELAEASALQPFAYTQLVWISIIGVAVFSESLRANVILGGVIVVGAGLFTLLRQRQPRPDRPNPPAAPGR